MLSCDERIAERKKDMKRVGRFLLVPVIIVAAIALAIGGYKLIKPFIDARNGEFKDYINSNGITDYKIPNGVTEIPDYAFEDCTTLESVIIPDSVTSIGRSAFDGCKNLKSVTIGKGVEYIDQYAFIDCESLESVYVDSIADWCEIEFAYYNSNPLYYANKLYFDGALVTELVIPDGVESIKPMAFAGCDELISVTVPNSVTDIDFSAFYGCTNIESITLPFVGNSSDDENGINLDEIFGESSVPESLKTVVITGGTHIGEGAFEGCDGLTSITLPDSITSIGDAAFYDCNGLTSITLPDSVTSIGNAAFSGCHGLTSITLPDRLTGIGDYAFYRCYGLASITLPNEITSIGDYAFLGCDGLAVITVPDSVESIGNYAFYYCENVKEVTIGNGVEAIGDYAFADLDKITDIIIPDSVKSIGKCAFEWCDELTSVTVGRGIESIGENAFYGSYRITNVNITDMERWFNISFENAESNPLQCGYEENLLLNGSLITDVYVPYTVTELKPYVFSGYQKLVSISLHNGVESINEGALSGCNPNTIFIPASVTYISDDAFDYCYMLRSIDVDENNTTYASADGILFSKDMSELVKSPTQIYGSYVIPDSVTFIHDGAFDSCFIRSITMGACVERIGDYAFSESLLSEIVFSDSITSIGANAFSGCSELTDVTISNGVISIGDYAFANCENMVSITLGKSVSEIGEGAFYYCESLTSIDVDADNATYCSIDGNLYSKDESVLILYAMGKTDTGFTVPTGVTRIGDNAFYGCDKLSYIDIPYGVESIEDGAFAGCENLRNINLPSSLTSLGDHIFGYYGYSDIMNYYRFGDAYYIGNSQNPYLVLVKSASDSTVDLVVHSDTRFILYSAFYGHDTLKTVILPDGILGIGDSAFGHCDNLESINLPDSITRIGEDAFHQTPISVLVTPEGMTKIERDTFYHCDFEYIFIPTSVTLIEEGAFNYGSARQGVYYAGDQDAWNAIQIEEGNELFSRVEIHFNSDKSELQ